MSASLSDGLPTALPAAEPAVSADVRLALAGDRAAFERLYRANVDRVFSLCARMTGDRELAEELTQDVFVRAWEKLALFRGESAFSTWLHRLAVNVVLAHKKSAVRWNTRFAGGDDNVASAAARVTLAPGDLMDLEEAMKTLPPGARRVFVLHDVEGYTHEEIGQMLGVTPGGTKAQLHRARMLLRQALNR